MHQQILFFFYSTKPHNGRWQVFQTLTGLSDADRSFRRWQVFQTLTGLSDADRSFRRWQVFQTCQCLQSKSAMVTIWFHLTMDFPGSILASLANCLFGMVLVTRWWWPGEIVKHDLYWANFLLQLQGIDQSTLACSSHLHNCFYPVCLQFSLSKNK